jgi:hypothetical protein
MEVKGNAMEHTCFEEKSTKNMRWKYHKSIAWGLLVSAIMVCSAPSSQAASVTLGWDPSSDPDVAGYNVYYGPSSRNYTNEVDAGNSTVCSIFGLVIGATYYFAVTAYNDLGVESAPSDEIVYTVPQAVYKPKIPATSVAATNGSFGFDVRFDPGQTVIVQSSTDLVHWVSVSTNMLTNSTWRITESPATNLMKVFRALLP